MTKQKWIVVADRTGARVFSAKPFSLLRVLRNELGREKNRAMTTDKPGSARGKTGKPFSTYSLTRESSPHEQAAIQFATRLARYLRKSEGSFDELMIAAEPRMLGRIRSALGKDIHKACEWLTKDMVHMSNLDVGRSLGMLRSQPVKI